MRHSLNTNQALLPTLQPFFTPKQFSNTELTPAIIQIDKFKDDITQCTVESSGNQVSTAFGHKNGPFAESETERTMPLCGPLPPRRRGQPLKIGKMVMKRACLAAPVASFHWTK